MKYVIYAVDIFLLLMIPTVLFIFPAESDNRSVDISAKKLNSSEISTSAAQFRMAEGKFEEPPKQIEVQNTPVVVNVAPASVSDVLETQIGTMSAYGPDCSGCSGKVGGGQVVTNGNIYYNDATYGQVRIVAGDRRYPYGTIIRVVNSKAGVPFYAVVLDRGGDIGIGRRFMFDLLCNSESEASSFGTSYKTTFEVVRYGF